MRYFRRLTHATKNFLELESAGGIVMIAAAAFAILLANSPLSQGYHQLITANLFGHVDVELLVKDVLMVIFFFAIGMELKIEMREGALAAKGQKILPLIAAIGGIVVPAMLYLAITHDQPQLHAGWAIPTATDIAFALCVLRLIGPAVPQPAKIFLLAIAIYDDLAAILIIALFYSSGLAIFPLAAVAALGALLYILNRVHISSLIPYLLTGIALWFALHEAGIHPTVAGVMTGIAIPLRKKSGDPLLNNLLHKIHPSVAFLILPIFAFTSAGVDIRGISIAAAFSALPVGITLALFFGKQLGILAATYACVKGRLASLPNGVNWPLVYGIAILAGIGFTMSLFIGKLAFTGAEMQDELKLGVLAGSLLSSLWGLIYLRTRRTA
ncbi:MAG: Na+/H+ antiporter NhaA [Rickettsiales bacterium]